MKTIPLIEYDVRADLGSPEWYIAPVTPTLEQLNNLSEHVDKRHFTWLHVARLNLNWQCDV